MHLSRRHLLGGLAFAAAARETTGAARSAGAYPDDGPITLIAPFSAGGAADIAARTLAAHAPRHLARSASMVVQNRAGASGAAGTLAVARAQPDGYTLLLARVGSSAILPATDTRTPYAWDAFTMLALLDENPFVICVRAEAPWRTLGELVGVLRDAPGALSFATTGPTTILDLGIRQLFAVAGLPVDAGVAVPFRGGGEAVAALLAGQVQFIGNNLSETKGPIVSGALRPLVVGTAQPLADWPQVPTAVQAEVPALAQISGWDALFGPPGLPEPVLNAWSRAITGLRDDPEWLAATRAVGGLPRLLGPTETRAFVGAQVLLYRDLAKRLGMF